MEVSYTENKVIDNFQIEEHIYRLTVETSTENIVPGQFFMLRAWDKDPLLSRPISVFDFEPGKVTFLYQVIGKGTKLLSKLKQNDTISLLGPSGNGFDLSKINGKVAVVTGGIGIAPMFYLVKKLKNERMNNVKIDLYSGFKDKPYILEEIKSFMDNIYVATDSGSFGIKGFVTDIFSPDGYDKVLCCGPEVMMNKVVHKCKAVGVPMLASLEKNMACGIGACLGCTCKTDKGNKRVCKDGPVFSGDELLGGEADA